MFYNFPVGLTINEVRRVISAHNERIGAKSFIEKDCGDHVIFNYIVAFKDSFPQPDNADPALYNDYAILRECRGLIMDKATGRVMARRYQKFFNVNEKPFTQASLVDWSAPHDILEKLDGSLITPLVTDGQIRFGTKMGVTDVAGPVEDFIEAHPQYVSFAEQEIAAGNTPMFEWCSRKQKIVIDYPEDRLVLTALRNNQTGIYFPQQTLEAEGQHWGIPVVRALPGSIENIEEFMAEARDVEGEEGYIIRFHNGHMLKVKGAWYCAIHGTKDLLQMEKDVWALVLENRMDDAMSLMDEADRDRCERFVTAMEREIAKTAEWLGKTVAVAYHECDNDKKRFATEWAQTWGDPRTKGLLFSIWDGKDPQKVFRDFLSKNTGSITKVNAVRDLVGGITWDNFRDRRITSED